MTHKTLEPHQNLVLGIRGWKRGSCFQVAELEERLSGKSHISNSKSNIRPAAFLKKSFSCEEVHGGSSGQYPQLLGTWNPQHGLVLWTVVIITAEISAVLRTKHMIAETRVIELYVFPDVNVGFKTLCLQPPDGWRSCYAFSAPIFWIDQLLFLNEWMNQTPP